MDLYFSPLACSMATRIAFYEAGAPARFLHVDTKAGRVEDGSDFRAINPLGQVPVLRTDSGEYLSENGAVLQFVADSLPEAHLAPPGGFERARLQQWLSFIGTELHKGVFIALLDPHSPDGAKQFARAKAAARLSLLDRHLAGRDYLLDGFTVADAYLVTVLNWCIPTGIQLADYPALRSYHLRLLRRPSVARAVSEERALYLAAHPGARLPDPPAPAA